MLTAKCISKSGHESINEISRAAYNPPLVPPTVSQDYVANSVFLEHPNGLGGGFYVCDGVVYIMNSEGNTVAKWALEIMAFPT